MLQRQIQSDDDNDDNDDDDDTNYYNHHCHNDDDEYIVVWTSDDDAPFTSISSMIETCFVTIRDHQAILGIGRVGGVYRVIWESDDNDYEDDFDNDEYDNLFQWKMSKNRERDRARHYLDRLDNDGSFTVYREATHESSPQYDDYDGDGDEWGVLMKMMVQVFELGKGNSSRRENRCIYSTSPLGCNRVGRKPLYVAKDTVHNVEKLQRWVVKKSIP